MVLGPEQRPPDPPASVADYAIVGDCRSAALVSRTGSIDWLCWPHFASPSIFAAMLDELSGGRFAVGPAVPGRSERRYVRDTNVLETRHVTAHGELTVTDLMPVASEKQKRHQLVPEHELLRLARCTRGELDLEVRFEPRFDYGRRPASVRRRAAGVLACQRMGSVLLLASSLDLDVQGTVARGRVRMRAGDVHVLSLTYCDGEPAMLPGLGRHALDRLQQSIEWWRGWVGHCQYDGPYRDQLVRSLLTLKLLTFAPSGAIIAAPTTSLPEVAGGERNWDYRYCWVRDASLVIEALLDLGYKREASAYVGWLLHTTRRTAPAMGVLYDVFGLPRIREREIRSLSGFGGARPVRVGNAAHGQLQLDGYGEVIAAVAEFARRGGEIEPASKRLLVGFGREVCRRWREPDEGLWEVRNGRRHNTHSKLLCWTALDQLLALQDKGVLEAPAALFRRERDAIERTIEARAYDGARNCYVATYGGEALDASLLLMPYYGYLPWRDARAIGTRERVERELAEDHLVARYRHADGLIGREAAFGACCFWLVQALVEQGEHDRARRHLDALLRCGNDVGLFAEELSWKDGSPLGNFPQGFTHVGAVNAILAVARTQGARRFDQDRGCEEEDPV